MCKGFALISKIVSVSITNCGIDNDKFGTNLVPNFGTKSVPKFGTVFGSRVSKMLEGAFQKKTKLVPNFGTKLVPKFGTVFDPRASEMLDRASQNIVVAR